MSDTRDFVVRRDDLRHTAFVPARQDASTALADGEVLVRVDRFALTANNVTYGAVGDMVGYWKFFPADEGWGRIPVWGFADVVRSQHPGVPAGERLYGYFPMSPYLVLRPDDVGPDGFTDATPHRAELPPIYSRYLRVGADPGHDRATEGHVAIFRPLFTTSFLLADHLAAENGFGARTVVLSSASSKTALGLAFLLARDRRAAVVGLTSAANRGFVAETGYYDRVLTYDQMDALADAAPAVLVDFAGNAGVVRTVHERLGDGLRASISVGITHWERMAPPTALPGPTPAFFFAPDHAMRRVRDWGAAEFQRRVAEGLRAFLASARWLRIVEGRGPAAIEAAYGAMVDGRAAPAEGHVLSW